jgi:1-acyl-sn-glycerol-3-phosphate acyltransferase
MFKTFYCFGYVVISALYLFPIGIFAMLFHLIGLKKLAVKTVYLIEKSWAWPLVKLTGCKITVSGVENIPKDSGFCLISNHDSYFDIPLIFAYSSRPIGFIAKKELSYVPFLNCWIYFIGGLFIDRGLTRNAIKTIHRGVDKIKAGGSLVIFPEGHRAKGRGLLPFHPGSLKLATMAEAPIVPVAIKGSGEVFETTGRVRAVPIELTFCKAIDTSGLSKEEKKQILCDRIYEEIKKQIEK